MSSDLFVRLGVDSPAISIRLGKTNPYISSIHYINGKQFKCVGRFSSQQQCKICNILATAWSALASESENSCFKSQLASLKPIHYFLYPIYLMDGTNYEIKIIKLPASVRQKIYENSFYHLEVKPNTFWKRFSNYALSILTGKNNWFLDRVDTNLASEQYGKFIYLRNEPKHGFSNFIVEFSEPTIFLPKIIDRDMLYNMFKNLVGHPLPDEAACQYVTSLCFEFTIQGVEGGPH